MDNGLKNRLEKFLDVFEKVFHKDWDYSKEMMCIQQVTEEQKRKAKDIGLETVEMIASDGTFLYPNVEDENENWGYRGMLLKEYRELKKILK